ncbi:hypothetical protein J3F83DRAFT_710862 [Trichoderma novae-zelandiae]
MSRNAPDGGDANISSTSSSRPGTNQGSIALRTPQKQQQDQQRLHTFQTPPSVESPTPRHLGTGRTATDLDSECATSTPAPHRYGLRARRASRGSFSTPSRRQQQQQQQQQLTTPTPTRTSGSGAAAIRTGSPLSYGIDH